MATVERYVNALHVVEEFGGIQIVEVTDFVLKKLMVDPSGGQLGSRINATVNLPLSLLHGSQCLQYVSVLLFFGRKFVGLRICRVPYSSASARVPWGNYSHVTRTEVVGHLLADQG